MRKISLSWSETENATFLMILGFTAVSQSNSNFSGSKQYSFDGILRPFVSNQEFRQDSAG